eukprot:scaffold214921_cov19-Tisochrysis_lutea.AAC.1
MLMGGLRASSSCPACRINMPLLNTMFNRLSPLLKLKQDSRTVGTKIVPAAYAVALCLTAGLWVSKSCPMAGDGDGGPSLLPAKSLPT